MDTLTFIAEMTKALAWPLAVVGLVLLLRRPLSQLIPLLQRLRYGGLELDFGRRVRELAAVAEGQLPARDESPAASEAYVARLARLSPRAVVVEAWLRVEEAALEAGQKAGLGLTSRELRQPLLLGQALEDAGLMDEQQMEIFHRLRNLRNAAAHASDFELEPEAAL